MFQRLQTVFLLIAIICLGLFLWMPVIKLEAPKYNEIIQGWDVRHLYNGYIYFLNAVLAGTAIGIMLVGLILYRNRSLQMLLCWFAVFFTACAEAYVYYKYDTKVFIGDVVLTKWNLLAVAAILFEILAIAYIRKDEAIIKNLDRLR